MENASKALLIAGAILLVIAIIAIAMSILNQGQEVTGRVSGQFDTLTIQSHNSQFNTYTALDRITKSQLLELVAKVKSSNRNNFDLDGAYYGDYHVYLGFKATAAGAATWDENYDPASLTAKPTDDPTYAGCAAAIAAANTAGNSFYRVTISNMSDQGIITGLTVAPAIAE